MDNLINFAGICLPAYFNCTEYSQFLPKLLHCIFQLSTVALQQRTHTCRFHFEVAQLTSPLQHTHAVSRVDKDVLKGLQQDIAMLTANGQEKSLLVLVSVFKRRT